MKKDFLQTVLSISIGAVLFFGGCIPEEIAPLAPPSQQLLQKYSHYTLPITERAFYLGVIPTPKNYPRVTPESFMGAYTELQALAEVTMVWSMGVSVGTAKRLRKSRTIEGLERMGFIPVLTLNFSTIKEVPGKGLVLTADAPAGVEADIENPTFRRLWVAEARTIAKEFKPRYFSLGNEINSWYEFYPETFASYVSLYKQAYDEIKKVSPQTKVFVVFSLSQMYGQHDSAKSHWKLIEMFEPQLDLVGFTTYPWHHFSDPTQIPDNYYKKLSLLTDRPIAFTEIGWVSDEGEGSSQKEQAEFLLRFLELTKGINIEMVHWLFLHEQPLSGIVGSVSRSATSTISLKQRDGRKKAIYDLWMDVKNLPLQQ